MYEQFESFLDMFSGEKEEPAGLPSRSAAVERILLLCLHQQPQLRPYEQKPHLCTDPVEP